MPTKTQQLFIFPYAGGSIASFRRLTDLIDESVDVVTVEYAGRGTRAKEPFAESFPDLAEDAAAYCLARRKEEMPFSVMGYSMGSIAAFETLAKRKLPGRLKHFFIAAETAPDDRSLELRKVKDPTDERILERARILGGLDEMMLRDKRFERIYVRPMMSDYRLFFGYRFSGCPAPIPADATVFYCEKDTPLAHVRKWAGLIGGGLEFHELGENHFFINQHYKEMAGVINEVLAR